MDIRTWVKQNTTSNKSDNGNDSVTETRPRREVSLAAGEQAAASSCSFPPELLPSPPAPEQAPGSSKALPPDDLGKEEPLQVSIIIFWRSKAFLLQLMVR
ncbi:hypothetical protein ABVT39_011145 [Epinephelus coioides]